MSDRIAYVTIPVAGTITVTVEDFDPSASDHELLEVAYELIDCGTVDGTSTVWNEWEAHEQLVSGNVIHFWDNEFSVEREGDIE